VHSGSQGGKAKAGMASGEKVFAGGGLKNPKSGVGGLGQGGKQFLHHWRRTSRADSEGKSEGSAKRRESIAKEEWRRCTKDETREVKERKEGGKKKAKHESPGKEKRESGASRESEN